MNLYGLILGIFFLSIGILAFYKAESLNYNLVSLLSTNFPTVKKETDAKINKFVGKVLIGTSIIFLATSPFLDESNHSTLIVIILFFSFVLIFDYLFRIYSRIVIFEDAQDLPEEVIGTISKEMREIEKNKVIVEFKGIEFPMNLIIFDVFIFTIALLSGLFLLNSNIQYFFLLSPLVLVISAIFCYLNLLFLIVLAKYDPLFSYGIFFFWRDKKTLKQGLIIMGVMETLLTMFIWVLYVGSKYTSITVMLGRHLSFIFFIIAILLSMKYYSDRYDEQKFYQKLKRQQSIKHFLA